ncbi:MAG: IS200/IS605 family transposase [Candidatus Paceibacterota bacterium]|jgi:putative transposase|nr:IS200/IS605 family transposase [Candidatus Paceibacterota bacterium]
MAVVKTRHNAYTAHYQIVFPVKYRKSLLTDEIPLVSFPPKYGGSQVVRIFKSITAKQLFKKFPELRKELWGGEFWSDGFYFATVGERGNWHVVEKYVAEQGKTMGETPQLKLFE